MTDAERSAGPGPLAGDLAAALSGWIDRLLPDRPRAGRLTADLLETFGRDQRPVSAAVVAEMTERATAYSTHLELEFVASGDLVPDVDPPGWPATDPDAVGTRAAWVSAVTRRPDGVGVLTLDNLDDVQLASPYLEAAFSLLDRSVAVVLDLRGNGGGDPGTVALVLSWLLGDEHRHFADVVRMDGCQQWWTTPRPADRSVPRETPVAVLIGRRTYSSGEALAYFIQRSGRATLVGQPTRGAADHITPITITRSVRGVLPEAYYRDPATKANWEGVGVSPDVVVSESQALEAATALLRHR